MDRLPRDQRFHTLRVDDPIPYYSYYDWRLDTTIMQSLHVVRSWEYFGPGDVDTTGIATRIPHPTRLPRIEVPLLPLFPARVVPFATLVDPEAPDYEDPAAELPPEDEPESSTASSHRVPFRIHTRQCCRGYCFDCRHQPPCRWGLRGRGRGRSGV